jgi:hypothetical protein
MRQFILIAAAVLISASAHADGPRGLSLASDSEVVTTAPLKPDAAVPAPKSDLLKAEGVASDTKTDAIQQPSAEDPPQAGHQRKSDSIKSASAKIERPKHERDPLEAHVIDELHRHGIYW